MKSLVFVKTDKKNPKGRKIYFIYFCVDDVDMKTLRYSILLLSNKNIKKLFISNNYK